MTDSLQQYVASEVRAELARQRMTGARLAKELGVSAQWVSYRLTGQCAFDVAELGRIAEILGVSVSQFVTPTTAGRGAA